MAESNRIVHSQDAKSQAREITKIKSIDNRAMPSYVAEFLIFKAEKHTEVFHCINQYLSNMVSKYRRLAKIYLENYEDKKGKFARWLTRHGDTYLFDIHAFHNAYISPENSHPTTGINFIINLSLYDSEDINAVNIISVVVNEEFFDQSDLEEIRILRKTLNSINPLRFRMERAINPRLNDICAPSTMSLDNRMYKFYDSLSRNIQSIATCQIVSTFNKLKIGGKGISDVDTNSLSTFFRLLKHVESNYACDLSRDHAYVEMLDRIFYIKKFLQAAIEEEYIINSGLPDCCVIHESVRELNNALVRHDQERYKLMKECQMMEECQTNANCQSR